MWHTRQISTSDTSHFGNRFGLFLLDSCFDLLDQKIQNFPKIFITSDEELI